MELFLIALVVGAIMLVKHLSKNVRVRYAVRRWLDKLGRSKE